MDLEQVRIFISVVENSGFTRAAEVLNLSHSTTSRSVAALEESLDVSLLRRDTRSIKLTPAGEVLFDEGKKLLSHAAEIEKKVRNAAGTLSGGLSIAGTNIKSEAFADICSHFCTEYPNVVLGIHRKELSEVMSQVRNGRADIGISFSYALPTDAEEYMFAPIEHSSFCALVSKESSLAGKKYVTIAELRRENYVGVGSQRSSFTRKIEEPIISERPAEELMSVPSLETLFMNVRCGNGVTLVPKPMARQFAEDCVMIELRDEDTSFDVTAFWRRDNDNPAVALFAGFIHNMAG